MKILFDVSKNFITAQLLQGIVISEKQVLDIDFAVLQKSERELILKYFDINTSKQELTAKSYEYRTIEGNTIQHLIDTLKTISTKQAQDKIDAERVRQERNTKAQNDFLQGKFADFSFATVYEGGIMSKETLAKISECDYFDYSKIASENDRRISEKEAIEKENQAKKERADKEAAEKKAAIESGKEILKQWALQNGSELLKLRIEEQMNWYELAQKEWVKINYPNYNFWSKIYTNNVNAKDFWTIKDATTKQIKSLRSIREANPNCPCSLVRIKFENDEYDYYEDDSERFSHVDYISIDIPSLSTEVLGLCIECPK